MRPISIALAITDVSLREDLRREFERHVVRLVLDQPYLKTSELMQLDLDLAVIDTEPEGETVQGIIQRIRKVSPRTAIAVASRRPDAQGIVDCVHAGANEFVIPPFEDSVKVIVERARALAISRDELGRAPARVIGFVSAKGGCGATSVAVHVAAALARRASSDVLLADLDCEVGLIEFLTRPRANFSLLDAVENIHRLDFVFWKRNIATVRPHLDVLTWPLTTIRREHTPRENYRKVLRLIRSTYGWAIADLGRGLSPVMLNLLEELDDLYLVTTPRLEALHQAQKSVERLSEHGYPRVRLHVLVNGVRPKTVMPDVQGYVGAPVYAELPDGPELQTAYSQARLLAPETPLGAAFEALAARIGDVPMTYTPPKGRTFFGLRRMAPQGG